MEFASKWAEAVWQSLHYAIMTGKRLGIVPVLEGKSDQRYFDRVMEVAGRSGIEIWTVLPETLR